MKYLMFVTISLFPLMGFAMGINTYYVDIVIDDNSDIVVNETISYELGEDNVSSITHNIPLRYALESGQRQSMDVLSAQATINDDAALVDVQSDARSADLVVSLDGGEPLSGTVNLGLEYRIEGPIRYFDRHNQLVWDPMTTKVTTGIDQFAGSIHIPREFKMLSPLCVVVRDDMEYGCNISPRIEGGFIAYYAHIDVQEGDEISMDARFNTGVEVTVRSIGWTWWEWALFFAGVICALGLIIALTLYAIYRFLLPEDKRRYYSQKYKGKPQVEEV